MLKIGVASLVLLMSPLAFVSFIYLPTSGPPSDKALEAIYINNPDSFGIFEQLISHNPNLKEFSGSAAILTSGKVLAGKDLKSFGEIGPNLKRTGIFRIKQEVNDKHVIWLLTVYSERVRMMGPFEELYREKGYVYAPDHVSLPVVDSLEVDAGDKSIALKSLAPNWYLYRANHIYNHD